MSVLFTASVSRFEATPELQRRANAKGLLVERPISNHGKALSIMSNGGTANTGSTNLTDEYYD